MNVLICHNYYQQPGGEDHVFADESRLLEERGHQVTRFTIHNDAIADISRVALAARTIWNTASSAQLSEHIRRVQPQVVHFHNTFPLISPSAYYAAHRAGAAVVQTLHNFRLVCPNALLFRDGHVCEECLSRRMPWPGIAHRCYRGSRATTATVAAMLTIHRAARTWDNAVDAYIALTEFARRKLIEGGLPASKIHVKPNFVHPDPGVADGSGGYALFVGRLTPEKGLLTLLAAWERLDGMIPLKIVGDGPLQSPVREAERRFKCIQWLGQCPTQETHRLIGAATMLIFPSTWYETFGRVAIEAFAKGTPVIASNLGAMAELVDHGRTGYLFPAGNAVALADTIQQMVASANDLKSMRRAARAEFEGKYTAEQNGPALEAIYRAACRVAHRSTTRRSS